MLPARSIVASTLSCGGIATREAPNTCSGKVMSEPALKNVMMKSSMLRANDSNEAARIPGRINGNVIFQKARLGEAPRSIAACSRVQSNPRMRARNVTATNEIWNMMWAITTVTNPRSTPRDRNNVASDEPSTISGDVSGRTRNRLMAPLPLKR